MKGGLNKMVWGRKNKIAKVVKKEDVYGDEESEDESIDEDDDEEIEEEDEEIKDMDNDIEKLNKKIQKLKDKKTEKENKKEVTEIPADKKSEKVGIEIPEGLKNVLMNFEQRILLLESFAFRAGR